MFTKRKTIILASAHALILVSVFSFFLQPFSRTSNHNSDNPNQLFEMSLEDLMDVEFASGQFQQINDNKENLFDMSIEDLMDVEITPVAALTKSPFSQS